MIPLAVGTRVKLNGKQGRVTGYTQTKTDKVFYITWQDGEVTNHTTLVGMEVEKSASEIKDEIKRLAYGVFDYEDWVVIFWSFSSRCSVVTSGGQMATMTWENVQDCIDDLRARLLTRGTGLRDYFHDQFTDAEWSD